MLNAFTEIGWGNPSFISTEIEYPDGSETRQKGFVPFCKVKSVYGRCWVGKQVYIISSNQGFTQQVKPRQAFKLLLGIHGEIEG